MTTYDAYVCDVTKAYLEHNDVAYSGELLVRYSVAAAHWKRLRLRYQDKRPTPVQREQFDVLTESVRRLSAALDLPTTGCDTRYGVAGVTDPRGFLGGDPGRILYESWEDELDG